MNMTNFIVKHFFVYMMKIHKYERTLLFKKYAHNITLKWSLKKYSPLMMSSPYITLRK